MCSMCNLNNSNLTGLVISIPQLFGLIRNLPASVELVFKQKELVHPRPAPLNV